jgi:hypothetical protein
VTLLGTDACFIIHLNKHLMKLSYRLPCGCRRILERPPASGYFVAMAVSGGKSPGVDKSPAVELEVGDRLVRISNPDRVYFPARGETKLDLANYYLSVGEGIVRALRERPCMMHRFPKGVSGEKVHQGCGRVPRRLGRG